MSLVEWIEVGENFLGEVAKISAVVMLASLVVLGMAALKDFFERLGSFMVNAAGYCFLGSLGLYLLLQAVRWLTG